jgi:hypothetical protein
MFRAGSLDALWVTRPEAVGLERTKAIEGITNHIILTSVEPGLHGFVNELLQILA